MKKVLFILAAALCLSASLYAQQARIAWPDYKFETVKANQIGRAHV